MTRDTHPSAATPLAPAPLALCAPAQGTTRWARLDPLAHLARQPALLGAVALSVAALAAGLLVAARSQAQDAPKAKAANPALSVAVVSPTSSSLAQRLSANGSLAAWQEASVGAEVAGLRLTEVRVNVGDAVRKGQVLATFAADTVRADIALAEASVAEAQAALGEAAANAQRARSIEGTGALSASQVAQYLTAEQTAQARLQAARAQLESQRLRLAQTQVLAPDDGTISARQATVGAVVGAGAELFRLIRQGRIEWRAEVTSAELGRLPRGTPARLTTASGAELEGQVRMVAPSVDASTRNALVYVDVKAKGKDAPPALPGMFARGEFVLGSSPALTVPQTAVVVRDGFSYVFRVGPDNRVAQLKVQTGRQAGERIEVVAGLKPDERVVASGASFLNDGDTVRVVEGK